MKKSKSIVILAIILFFTILLGLADFVSFAIPNSVKDFNSIASTIGLGIDLKGGYYAVLTPEKDSFEESEEYNFDDLVNSAVDILRNRLDNKGYTEATITIQGVGDDREVRIEVPEVEDVDEFMSIIGSSGELKFIGGSDNVTYLTGDDVAKASAGYDEDGNYAVNLEFKESGVAKFSQATSKNAGSTINIYVGDDEVSTPSVKETITNRTCQITGSFTLDEVESLAAIINAGKMPMTFTVGESNKVSATLGENALKGSIIAGAIALLIIFAILIIKYRGLGIAASFALVIYTFVFILFLALIPFVELTLPGIAGIILSIGMAVDANVIIFERVNEEFAAGKTVRSAINSGFKRAFLTILDSNVTTILAAIVLWILCPGSIKGFAVTLLIGIVLSMITSILLTRSLANLFYPIVKDQAKFYNLKKGGLIDEEA